MLSKTIVKYIQSLAHKKLRDEEGVFVAEGPKVTEELLRSGLRCVTLCGLSSWMEEHHTLVEKTTAEKYEISDSELERISHMPAPNKVVAVFEKKKDTALSIEHKISLMLDEIQDPGNMGTIIRTADWFGVENIVCSHECADQYNPKVVQSSMGSIARVNVFYTSLENFIQNTPGLKIYAATLDGKDISSYSIKEGLILIGNESKGVKPALLQHVTGKIKIHGKGHAESLNAAVACGIILSRVC